MGEAKACRTRLGPHVLALWNPESHAQLSPATGDLEWVTCLLGQPPVPPVAKCRCELMTLPPSLPKSRPQRQGSPEADGRVCHKNECLSIHRSTSVLQKLQASWNFSEESAVQGATPPPAPLSSVTSSQTRPPTASKQKGLGELEFSGPSCGQMQNAQGGSSPLPTEQGF